MAFGQDSPFQCGDNRLVLQVKSFSPSKNRPPSHAADTKIQVHPDMLMKTNGRSQKQGNVYMLQADCISAKKKIGGSKDVYENKGRKKRHFGGSKDVDEKK